MRAKVPGDSRKEKWWRAALARQAESNVSAAAFFKFEGLNQNTYCYWRAEI